MGPYCRSNPMMEPMVMHCRFLSLHRLEMQLQRQEAAAAAVAGLLPPVRTQVGINPPVKCQAPGRVLMNHGSYPEIRSGCLFFLFPPPIISPNMLLLSESYQSVYQGGGAGDTPIYTQNHCTASHCQSHIHVAAPLDR